MLTQTEFASEKAAQKETRSSFKPGAASPDHSDHRAISEAAVSQMSPGVQ